MNRNANRGPLNIHQKIVCYWRPTILATPVMGLFNSLLDGTFALASPPFPFLHSHHLPFILLHTFRYSVFPINTTSFPPTWDFSLERPPTRCRRRALPIAQPQRKRRLEEPLTLCRRSMSLREKFLSLQLSWVPLLVLVVSCSATSPVRSPGSLPCRISLGDSEKTGPSLRSGREPLSGFLRK